MTKGKPTLKKNSPLSPTTKPDKEKVPSYIPSKAYAKMIVYSSGAVKHTIAVPVDL
jgi:hypothetical protein